tara:strand:+ start:762 stop:2093 length:1332 start_codon:yes stop_codon:yes gene_type:complete
MIFKQFHNGVLQDLANKPIQEIRREDLLKSLQHAYQEGVRLTNEQDGSDQQWDTSVRQLKYLKTIAELIPASLFAKNKDGQYNYVNNRFLEMVGLTDRDELLLRRPSDIFGLERGNVAEKEDKDLLNRRVEFIYRENQHVEENGSAIWVLVSKVAVTNPEGEVIGIVGMILDISERKEAEERLAEVGAEIQRKNEALEKDLLLARQVQQALLPQIDKLNTIEFLDLGFSVRHSDKIGGDFIQIQKLNDFKTGFLICDVMGHGIQAALITSLIKGLIGDLFHKNLDPGEFIQKLNTRFHSVMEFHDELVFATALYLEWEHGGHCRYANAGHPCPLLLSKKDNQATQISSQSQQDNIAVGIVSDTSYDTFEFDAEKGDSIILYSDGIEEFLNLEDQEYGIQGLLFSLQGQASLNAQGIVDHMINQALAHSPVAPDDDVTLLVIKQ